MRGEPRPTAAVKRRLETKNDESRFGLTRAPFFKRRGSLERGQSLARHRAAQSGNRKIKEGTEEKIGCKHKIPGDGVLERGASEHFL